MGLKSHARNVFLSGTTVPPLVAEAAGIAKGNAVADISKVAAHRVRVRIGRVIDIVSILFTTNAMTVWT
jgi:hypothetical protein